MWHEAPLELVPAAFGSVRARRLAALNERDTSVSSSHETDRTAGYTGSARTSRSTGSARSWFSLSALTALFRGAAGSERADGGGHLFPLSRGRSRAAARAPRSRPGGSSPAGSAGP